MPTPPEPTYSSPTDTDCRPCALTGVRISELKRILESEIPDGEPRRLALERIAILDPARPPAEEEQRAASWQTLENTASEVAATDERLVGVLHRLGCNVRDQPHVLRGLIAQLDFRFEKGSPVAAALAGKFLDESCDGRKGLSAEELRLLREIRDRPPPAPAEQPVPAREVPKRNQPG